ncbi:ABC transporter permease [Enterococcus sp. LJL90]
MTTTIKQEVFKLAKQQLIIKQSLALTLLIIGMALVTKFGNFELLTAENLVPTLFNSSWLIVFSMVYLASQIFSMEFRFGTIKNMLQKDGSRSKIFFSKFFLLVGYSLYLNILAMILTVAISLVLFPEVSLEQSAIWQTLLTTVGAGFVGMWLFASLSLMISLIVQNESLAGMLGLISYFMSSMLAGVQFLVLDQAAWLKWNPFNMLNLANQLADSSLSQMTLLSTGQLVIGNFVYIALFILIAKVVFQRRKI